MWCVWPYMGGNLKQATCSFDVTVVDDETEFKDLYTTITPNTFYANKLGDDAWVLNLPTKQVYNGKDIKVNPKNQRIYYDMPSDSTLVFIDMADADYQQLQNFSNLTTDEQKALKNKVTSNKVRYNLSQDHVITVRSYAGTIKQYTLYCLIYPEFKTVTVNGVKGVLTRDAFNQDEQMLLMPKLNIRLTVQEPSSLKAMRWPQAQQPIWTERHSPLNVLLLPMRRQRPCQTSSLYLNFNN